MILHFSHIGLTDGRTFTLFALVVVPVSGGPALATGTVAATVLRRPAQAKKMPRGAPGDVSKPPRAAQGTPRAQPAAGSSRAPAAAGLTWRPAHAAARPPPASCHGVRILGPPAVMAIVNSKWAASEPSWE